MVTKYVILSSIIGCILWLFPVMELANSILCSWLCTSIIILIDGCHFSGQLLNSVLRLY